MIDRLKANKTLFGIIILGILAFALAITLLLIRDAQDLRGSAATPDQLETEAGALSSSGVNKQTDSGASGGQYVVFNKEAINSPSPQPGGPFAFPGAQGHGALAKGGRGGTVYEVTNLNNSGSGSLRSCVDASGPRTCVFRVSGTIVLCSSLTIRNPYITIAGQTSPGGIQIVAAKSGESCSPSGSGPHVNGLLSIATHDVIVRYLRLRNGKVDTVTGNQNGTPLRFHDGAYDVITDHNSIYWTQDENITLWTWNPPHPHNITISYNIVAEPLRGHSTSIIYGTSNGQSVADQIRNIDAHHNLLATNTHRNPSAGTARSIRWINNILYNYRVLGATLGGKVWADFINNIYKCGPASYATSGWGGACTLSVGSRELPSSGVRVIGWYDTSSNPGDASIFIKGNISKHHPDPNGPNEWELIVGQKDPSGYPPNNPDIGPLDSRHKRAAADCPGCSDWAPLPYGPGVPPIIAESALTLEESLGLGGGSGREPVGASRRLDCLGNWVSAYDSNDLRLINEYKTNTGPENPPEYGVRSVIKGVSPCTDSDKDGMPDAYEDANGLNKNNSSDGAQITSYGYSNLEHYINGI